MGSFALYTPQDASLPAGIVNENDSQPQPFQFSAGPDGTHGTWHFWIDGGRPVMNLTYCPRIQKWTQIGQQLWIGVERDNPVTPDGISRLQRYVSMTVMLADKQQWEIPVTARLPRTWGVGLDGSFTRQVRPEFRDYCEMSEAVWNDIVLGKSEDGERVQIPRAWEYCCRALALNYRVSPEIVSYLGLIDDTVVGQVLGASVELDTIVEVADLKKNSEDTASTPDTSQP